MNNAGDEGQVRAATEREAKRASLEVADLIAVMKLPEGRRFINRVIEFTGPLKEAFCPNGSLTNYTLGQQSVGRKLYADLDEACPDLFLKMRQEAKQ